MNEIIENRRSSRNYNSNRNVPIKIIEDIINAARWAPSSRNSQLWKYIIFNDIVPEELKSARSILVPGNQIWANSAPVLILSLVNGVHEDGSQNLIAYHDLGLANENLILQAISYGLSIRPMGGFDKKKAIEIFNIPPNFKPVAMFAVGYPSSEDHIDENIKNKETLSRRRKSIDEVAYIGSLDKPFQTILRIN